MLNPFFIRQKGILKKIDLLEVMCLQIKENYTRIFLSDGMEYTVRSTLAGALKKLPPDIFVRIHRDTIVSIYFIDDIARDHLILNGVILPISRQYYNPAIKRLNIIE